MIEVDAQDILTGHCDFFLPRLMGKKSTLIMLDVDAMTPGGVEHGPFSVDWGNMSTFLSTPRRVDMDGCPWSDEEGVVSLVMRDGLPTIVNDYGSNSNVDDVAGVMRWLCCQRHHIDPIGGTLSLVGSTYDLTELVKQRISMLLSE